MLLQTQHVLVIMFKDIIYVYIFTFYFYFMLYTDPAETHHTPAYTKQRRPKLTQRRPTQHSAGDNAYIYIYIYIYTY